MKWIVPSLVVGVLLGFLVGMNTPINLYEVSEPQVLGVCFSPNGGREETVLSWIGKANSSLHILIYSFTLDTVGDALVEARGRGVEIKVVFQKSQVSQYSEYQKLREAEIEVRNDTNSQLMHDKVTIVDGNVVLTGSFNWSSNAQKYNDENLVVIKDSSIASSYENTFLTIWDESI